MNVILLSGLFFLCSFFGMVLVLFRSSRRGRASNAQKELLPVIALYTKKLLPHTTNTLKKILLFLQKKAYVKKHRFFVVAASLFLKEIKKIEDALSGRVHIVRETSSQYLKDISDHKEGIQRRLSHQLEEELLD
jgi:hypothetical protein